MFKKKKFLVGGLIVLAAIAVLGYMGFKSSATYYYRVDELLAQGKAAYGKNLRVEGTVVADSVVKGAGDKLSFTIAVNDKSVPVVYQGVVPDTFYQANADVVVDGHLQTNGVFQADSLAAKCPSKYVPQPTPTQ